MFIRPFRTRSLNDFKIEIFWLIFSAVFFLTHSEIKANEWSNWLGPNHDGSIDNMDVTIPPSGKEYIVRWKKNIGIGWSSPIIDKNAVYLHDRKDGKEYIASFDLNTGDERWSFSYLSEYRDSFGMSDGPRSTPALSSGIMVSHGPQGLVHAVALNDGELIWVRDLKKDFSSPKGFFGRCSSPLIFEDKVILDVGGPSCGLVALSLKSGKTLWVSEPHGNDYSSPVPFLNNQEPLGLAFMRDGFLAVSLKTGQKSYFSPFRSPIDSSVNAASPLVLGNKVFISSCYEVGAGLWEYKKGSDGEHKMFHQLWRKNDVLDCHYSTPVSHGDYLFGFHGRQERSPVLRCVRLKDAEVQWSKDSMGAGNLIRVANKIFTITEKGELVIFSAKFSKFDILYSQQFLGTGVKSHFAIAGGVLVARDNRRLICLDLNSFD
jgi:outer membrane protein assembly factor BamB